MQLNTQISTNLLATFFANEFLISIIPKNEPILKNYRANIDNYCNSVTAFQNSKNPAYEILLEKLAGFYYSYTGASQHNFINFTCGEMCSSIFLTQMNDRDIYALYRKFITACVKSFAARALVISKEYVDILKTGKSKEYRENIVKSYENIILENKNQIYTEFAYLEKGKDPSTVSVINNENKVLEELRMQNEELRFENLQLKEQLLKITKKLENTIIDNEEEEIDI